MGKGDGTLDARWWTIGATALGRRVDPRRLRLLLTSTSIAAALVGGGAPAAWAQCVVNVVNNPSSGPVSNPNAINCINVQNSTVHGGVSNVGPGGVITTTVTPTGIAINSSTVTGTISNSGQIAASGAGISVFGNAAVGGGISNSGVITASTGILVGGGPGPGVSETISSFSGGITNSATITAFGGPGILVGGLAGATDSSVTISAFSGGILNRGTILAAGGAGIFVGGTALATQGTVSIGVVSFRGGVTNSATILASDNGIVIGGHAEAEFLGSGASVTISTFTGGVTNSGAISAGGNGIFVGGTAEHYASVAILSFSGGIANRGTISADGQGIFVGGQATRTNGTVSISDFSGGIVNTGTISTPSSGGNGIIVGGTAARAGVVVVSTFSGGIRNGGTLNARGDGIFIGGKASSGGYVAIASFSGGISNSNAITARGSGIAVGGTGFLGGFLMISKFSGGISNSGTILARGTGISVGGTAAFAGAVVISTFSGGINNSGSITATHGDGIFVGGSGSRFSTFAFSTFSGGITNSGMISTGRSGVGIDVFNVSAFYGGITNSGTISSGNRGAGIVIAAPSFYGNVWNSGNILGAHTGIYICSCVTFAGGSIVNTGTISAIEGLYVENSGRVSIFDSGTIVGSGGTAIDLRPASGGNTLTLGPGYSISGKVLGYGSDIFQLGGSGSGAFDLGSVGVARQYEGFTTFNVVSGVWSVSNVFGQTQSWNVDGGTLAGTGTLPGVNVNSGGTLEPGAVGVPGTFMTITGNLAFQSGALYLVNIGPTSASRVNVGGAVTLNGAVEGFLQPGSYSTKVTYNILDPASISGTFTGFTAINAPGFGGLLTYSDNTDVLLNLTAQLGAGGGLNQNQQNAAGAINAYFNSGGTLPAGFFPLFGLSGGNLDNALSLLDGEAATGAERSAFELTSEFLNLMLDPFVYGRGGGGGTGGGAMGFAPQEAAGLPPEIALAYAAVFKAPPKPPSFDQRWTAWGGSYGGSGTADGNAAVGSNNVTAHTFGFAGGMDYHVTPDTIAGFALAGGGTNWGLSGGLGGGRSDAFQAGLYGISRAGPAYLAAALSFTNHWFTTGRTAAFGDQLGARFDGQDYGARVETGYRYPVVLGRAVVVGVTPYAAVQAQDFHTPGYSENDLTGGGFGLSYAAMSASDIRSELGARFDNPTLLWGMPLILRGRLAWAHDWVSDPSLDAAFESLPGGSFTVDGAPIPRNSALASAGAELFLTANWSVIARFDGEFAGGAQTYAGSGTLRYTW